MRSWVRGPLLELKLNSFEFVLGASEFSGAPFCAQEACWWKLVRGGSRSCVAVVWHGFWTGGVGEFLCGDVAGGGGDSV